jgi:hypothetical protein
LRRVVRIGIRAFRLPRDVRSVFVSALLVGRIVASLLWIVCTFPVVRRFAVWRFGRRLRRSGLSTDVIDALTDSYASGMSLFGSDRCEEPSARS